ncbi:MAG: hypothetical protein FWC22_04705, partial [Treponema sp.]|nr:hypothetical protein [Treponema sp.]
AHAGWVNSVCFSPDGRQIISGSSDNTVKLWETATGRETRIFSGHKEWVITVAMSPDGRQILSGSRDTSINQWNVSSGNIIRTIIKEN